MHTICCLILKQSLNRPGTIPTVLCIKKPWHYQQGLSEGWRKARSKGEAKPHHFNSLYIQSVLRLFKHLVLERQPTNTGMEPTLAMSSLTRTENSAGRWLSWWLRHRHNKNQTKEPGLCKFSPAILDLSPVGSILFSFAGHSAFFQITIQGGICFKPWQCPTCPWANCKRFLLNQKQAVDLEQTYPRVSNRQLGEGGIRWRGGAGGRFGGGGCWEGDGGRQALGLETLRRC